MDIIEGLAPLFIVNCEDCLHGEHLANDCPHLDEDICMWQREFATQALQIITGYGYGIPDEKAELPFDYVDIKEEK